MDSLQRISCPSSGGGGRDPKTLSSPLSLVRSPSPGDRDHGHPGQEEARGQM